MGSEKSFENKVKLYLKQKESWFIKYWGGAEYTKSGVPDILASIDGKFYGIEIKANKGKPSILQLVNLRKIRKSGGVGVLLYPSDFAGFKRLVENNDMSWYKSNIELQDKYFESLQK